MREYLPELQRRSKWVKPTRNVKVGELVLVGQTGLPRGLWPLAVITEVVEGKDGVVRKLRVRTRTVDKLVSVVNIVPLELGMREAESDSEVREVGV